MSKPAIHWFTVALLVALTAAVTFSVWLSYRTSQDLERRVVLVEKDLGSLRAENNELRAENDELRAEKVANELDKILAAHDEIHKPSGQKDGNQPRADGLVLATTGDGLVEISIGEDDGLSKGQSLQVYRLADGVSTYLGRITVVRTSPDRSVCKVDPNYRKGTIQRGDRVASRLD